MVRKLSVILVLLSLACSVTGAAERPVRFTHIGVDEGLSQGTVNAICQDSAGNIWLGTEYGLNRYDGTGIRPYTERDGLPDNHIRKIHQAPDGGLWLCCGSYIVSYDSLSDSFRQYRLPSDYSEIYDFCFAPGGRIIAGCRYGMYCLDTASGSLDDGFMPDGLEKVRVSVFRPYGNEVWMATRDFGNHLYRWNMADSSVVDEPVGPHSTNLTDVALCGDSLWVATSAEGLILRTPSGIRTYTIKDGLCSNSVRALLKDRSGRLWVGTFKGANIIEGGVITSTFTKENGSLSHNTVRSLFEDEPEGGIWLGNYYFGVDYHHPFVTLFDDTFSTLGDPSLQDELISCLASKDGEMYLGVAGKGVWRYSSGKSTQYLLPNAMPGRTNPNDVKVIYPDPYTGKVYVGGHEGGFNELDPATGRFVSCSSRDMIHTYAVEPWGRDSLVVGALGGLFVFDKASRSYAKVANNLRVRTLRTDSDGNIWAGGENGLSIYGAKNLEILELPDELRQVRFVYSIFRSSSHEMYIITDDSILRIIPGEDDIIRYDAARFFAGKSVASIAEDADGILWMSTYNGLSRFNPDTGEVRHWSSSDGLPCPQFSRNATITTSDGRIVFGAHKGLVSFDPSTVVDNPYCADVQIEVTDVEGNRIPFEGTSFRLKRGRNTFALSFSSPNFASGKHTSFEYSVNGLWKESEGRTAVLQDLKPGKYHIESVAVNSTGKRSEGVSSVDVVIPALLWSWLAPSVLILLGISTMAIVRIRKRRGGNASEEPADEFANLSAAEKEFLLKADSIISANLGHPDFTVESFAKEMCVSKSTLQHKIKSCTGESALDRIRRFRFDKACKLLEENKLSVSQISEETGFRSPSYFSTSFKEYIGCLPSEYIKQVLHKS